MRKLHRLVVVLVLALGIAAPAAAHVPPIEIAPAIDLRAETSAQEHVQSFWIVAGATAFDEVAHLELPEPSLAAELAQRFAAGNVELRSQVAIFDRAVSRKLASGSLAVFEENNVSGESELRRELRRTIGYVRNRWYDPSTGTFLSPDPMGYEDSSNLYAFAKGDPVNGRDPLGLEVATTADGSWYVTNPKNGKRYLLPIKWIRENQLAAQDIIRFEGGLSLQETKDWMYDHDLQFTHDYYRPVVEKALPEGDNWAMNALIATSGLPPQNKQQRMVQGGLQIAGTAAMIIGGTYGNAGTVSAQPVFDLGKGPVPVSHAEAEGWVRDVPNQWGKKGSPAHQRVIDEVEADIIARGLRPRREFRVDTPGGKKDYRDIDIAAIDPATGRVVEIHQVGKGLKSNVKKPVVRERDAMRDLRNRPPVEDAKRFFHPYND